MDRRFNGPPDTPGCFLFEGFRGSGKSHLLLLVYHLFLNPKPAKGWLDRHGLKCQLPEDSVLVINKFTDLPLSSIWDFIFEKLTGKPHPGGPVQPSLKEVEEALGSRHLVLVLDELEQGIRVISDQASRAQNVAFLQMLSEWGARNNQVTLLASIYSDQEEPGATLKRVPFFGIRFEYMQDKAKVVLHRLFQNYLTFRPEIASSTIESYLAAWRKHGAVQSDDLAAQLRECYPFSPDLLKVILEDVPSRGGFQNVRGALGFLARMVAITYKTVDIISPAHADIADREIGIRLGDLDPSGDLIRKARENLKELSGYPLVGLLCSAVMLYTLSSREKVRGATREQLIRAVESPINDINQFEQSLLALQHYAAYFHVREGVYFFDPEENADAKVEFRSINVGEDRAQKLIESLWLNDLFRDAQGAVVLSRIDETHLALEGMEKGRLRFVLSPRRLKTAERRSLYYGLSERNQVVLLEPKDTTFDLLKNKDVIKWAQRACAAGDLVATSQDAQRRAEFERLAKEDRKQIGDAIRKAGLLFIRVENREGGENHTFEEESLGSQASKEEVVSKLSQQFFPTQLLAEDLLTRAESYYGRPIKEVDRDYRTLLGYPVPTHAGSLFKAVRSLCKEGKVGVRHSPGGNFCGRDPDLTDSELATANLDAPFEPTARPSPFVLDQPVSPVANPQPGTPTTISPTPADKVEQREIVIQAQTSIEALRQQAASRLQSLQGSQIIRVRFTIFLESSQGDLSVLPQALRGNLSGPGRLTAEISVTMDDVRTKGGLEQVIERLPGIIGANYSARIEILLPDTGEVEV